MQLPAPIRTYFEADGQPHGDPPMSAFAVDAVVEDEGRTHRGYAAIEAWWRSAKLKTEHTAKPFEIKDRGDDVVVRAKVSGNFRGSPAAPVHPSEKFVNIEHFITCFQNFRSPSLSQNTH